MFDELPLSSENWLAPLVAAQDALARLEAGAAAASEAVRDGLLARMACREAAGWLAHHGTWVHPLDLALREAGLTGSYAAAELGTRLPSVLPATARAMGAAADPPEDRDVAAALRLARRWRQLAALPSWSPPELAPLPPPGDRPPLLTAACLVRDAPGRLVAPPVLAAAWLWRERGGTGHPGLPLWSAPVQQLQRLALAPQGEFLAGFLGAVGAAAGLARRELSGLQAAEIRGAGLVVTVRSRLPEALGLALRRPVLTARMLADGIGVSHRAGLGMIGRLVAAGVLREATGRISWRGFVIAEGRK